MIKNKKGIIIGTSKYTKDFLKPLLESIKNTTYPILIVSNDGYNPNQIIKEFLIEAGLSAYWCDLVINDWNGWEISCIQRGKETYEEFIFLMDTTIIKDISLFDKVFEIPGHVVFTKGNFHYMGKFVSKDLPNLPIVRDKTAAIMLEVKWLDGFDYTEFKPDLPVHTNIFEEKFGQRRMKLENDYMIKWKGTWWITPEQAEELSKAIENK